MLEEGSRDLARTYSAGGAAPAPGCCFTRALTALDADARLPAPAPSCCRCAHKRRASPFACLAICFLVLTYNLLGGFLFLAIEGNLTEETAVAASKPDLSEALDLRSRTVERLWSITEDLNILYKENWTKLAAKELMDFQKVLVESVRGSGSPQSHTRLRPRPRPGAAPAHRWTFSSSFLYALTLITTIGSGDVTPTSAEGKLAAVAYSCLGIPIIMLYLSTIGEALARNFRVLYSKVCPSRFNNDNFHTRADCLNKYAPSCKRYDTEKKELYPEKRSRTPFQAALNLDSFGGGGGGFHWTCRDHTRVPLALSALPVALYVALGTLLFHCTERWDLVDGCFFSFASLATIGFGDLRPGRHAGTLSAHAEELALAACCLYILVGIVVIAMCFNLIHEDTSSVMRGVTALCGGGAGGGRSRVVDERVMPVVS